LILALKNKALDLLQNQENHRIFQQKHYVLAFFINNSG